MRITRFFHGTYHQSGIGRPVFRKHLFRTPFPFREKGTLRGLHFQDRPAQAKLVQVVSGEILMWPWIFEKVPPHFGQWAGVHLSSETKRQLFVSRRALPTVSACSAKPPCSIQMFRICMRRRHEGGILWSDPAIGIEWP